MKLKKLPKKLQTYGKRKNHSPLIRVLSFTAILFIFVFFLTIARSFIVENPPTTPITSSVVYQPRENSRPIKEVQPLSPELNTQILALSSNPLVQDLPKKASILLQVGANVYAIEKNSITAGQPARADLSIYIPVSYAQQLSEGLCRAISSANNEGALRIKQQISKTALLWKYKSMFKYRNCLGL